MSKRVRRLEARVTALESDVRMMWAELLKPRGMAVAPVQSPNPCETLITWGKTTVSPEDGKVVYTSPGLTSAGCWRIEGQDAYFEGDSHV